MDATSNTWYFAIERGLLCLVVEVECKQDGGELVQKDVFVGYITGFDEMKKGKTKFLTTSTKIEVTVIR